MWWVLLAGLALAAASELFKRRKLPELPSMSEEEFLRAYIEKFNRPEAAVGEGRRLIANSLGLPYDKLSPDQRFEDLAKYSGFITEYEVGMGHLGDELTTLCERTGAEKPGPFPSTVGEYIHQLARLKSDQAWGK